MRIAASFPERAPPDRAVHVETWRRLAAAFTPPTPEIAARLAAISPAR